MLPLFEEPPFLFTSTQVVSLQKVLHVPSFQFVLCTQEENQPNSPTSSPPAVVSSPPEYSSTTDTKK